MTLDRRAFVTGLIASTLVAHEKPSGYVALYDTFASAVNAISGKLTYDFDKDLRPVSHAVDSPYVMVVRTESPYKSVKDFVADARARPGQVNFASGGAGGVAHFAGEMLKGYEKIELVHVPYKGGAPALTDLMGGHVDSYFANVSSALPYLRWPDEFRAFLAGQMKQWAALIKANHIVLE
jgi:tripartite-type tricarboxylate transporter receptor subunit TctC